MPGIDEKEGWGVYRQTTVEYNPWAGWEHKVLVWKALDAWKMGREPVQQQGHRTSRKGRDRRHYRWSYKITSIRVVDGDT